MYIFLCFLYEGTVKIVMLLEQHAGQRSDPCHYRLLLSLVDSAQNYL